MNKRSFLMMALFAFLAITISFTTGCKTEGCTDPDSITFDAEADEDDGTCQYEGNVVFWYNQTASEGLIAADAQSLKFYVDEELIGSYASDVYFTSSPDCTTASVVTSKKDLGTDKKKSFSYKVIDDDDFTWWEGTIEYEANTCIALELQWSKKK